MNAGMLTLQVNTGGRLRSTSAPRPFSIEQNV